MSIISAGGAVVGAGGPSQYEIERSLRFNSADTAYLNRTPASASNRKTFTWSGWVKRGSLSTTQGHILFSAGGGSITAWLRFDGSQQLDFLQFNGSTFPVNLQTTAIFRDPSAWYHIVLAYDSGNATATNRVLIYVNGVSQALTGTQSSLNLDSYFNSTNGHFIGRESRSNIDLFNGYMTEIHFIDGQALDPTSFGAYNNDTGVWGPIAYTGTYGTNGFYLNFSDNSGVTSTTLGKDQAGSNNWTPNNFSVTAGADNDSLVDVPTLFGTDTGIGGEVRGNYATLNPLDANSYTESNGNLDLAIGAGVYNISRSTIGVSSGKWYAEVLVVSATGSPANSENMVGVCRDGVSIINYVGGDANGFGYFGVNGDKYNNGSASAYGASYTVNDVIGIALDLDAGTLVFYKNNVSQGTAYSSLSGTFYFAFSGTSSAQSRNFSVNFGQRPFAYTAPSGFKALVTTNLPDPTVIEGDEYFNTVLYTGTGASNARTGVGFQPDWVWIKERNAAADHGLYDAVRGVQNQLESNTDTVETTEATGLTAFGADGFTVGALAQLNTSGDTYVAWNWNAGGSNQTISVGQYATSPANVPSIASTVRASTDAGFSIVSFTSVASTNSTIGHGLGVAPSFVIVRFRSVVVNWYCWHSSFAGTEYIVLDSTAAKGSLASLWNSSVPTSTVFSMGTAWTSSAPSIAYCFAAIPGYSAFGSYTGNGSADGPFVFTGFRPAFVLIRRTDATADWTILDTARDPFNGMKTILYPNYSNGDDTGAIRLDSISNGFKIRIDSSSSNYNASGGTYIYMAFAESPFKFALAR